MTTVVGSLNLDMVARVTALPAEGETVLATGYEEHGGGKGANQALAAARAGAPVRFVVRVGRDGAGQRLVEALAQAGVDVTEVEAVDAATGRAWIEVDDAGANRIVVVPGANAAWSARELGTLFDADTEPSGWLLLQREVPDDVILEAARQAVAAGVPVMLNAAPAGPLPEGLAARLTTLVVNEHEAAGLLGRTDSAVTADVTSAAVALLELGPAEVVITLGADGAVFASRNEVVHEPAFVVEVVDTTAAGDTFVGAFATRRGEGVPVRDALRFACAAAAEAVRVAGAQSSIPLRTAIEARLGG